MVILPGAPLHCAKSATRSRTALPWVEGCSGISQSPRCGVLFMSWVLGVWRAVVRPPRGLPCCACMWPSPGDLGAGGGSRPQDALRRWPCCHRGVGSWKTKVFSFYFHVSPLSVPKSKNGLIYLWAFRLACLWEFITSGLGVTPAVSMDHGVVVRCLPLVRAWFCSFWLVSLPAHTTWASLCFIPADW